MVVLGNSTSGTLDVCIVPGVSDKATPVGGTAAIADGKAVSASCDPNRPQSLHKQAPWC